MSQGRPSHLALSRAPWEEDWSADGHKKPPWDRRFGGEGKEAKGDRGETAQRDDNAWLPVHDAGGEGVYEAPYEAPPKKGTFPAAIVSTLSQEERKVVREVKRWWDRMQERVRRNLSESVESLLRPEREEARVWEPLADASGKRRKRVTPSNYSAMEIHGFFGLIDDGPCSQGRMLICHIPSWVRGQSLEVRAGDLVHAWHVSGRIGGVLSVLDTGRHRYYSPGEKVTTCTICVPEEQWARFLE